MNIDDSMYINRAGMIEPKAMGYSNLGPSDIQSPFGISFAKGSRLTVSFLPFGGILIEVDGVPVRAFEEKEAAATYVSELIAER